MATTTSYTSEDIRVLTGVEAVRLRPGMYVGSVDADGLHHLLWEVVGNAIDDHLATALDGYVRVQLDDDRVIVEDNGRGISVDRATDGRSMLELVMTNLHAGTAKRPHTHLGVNLRGVGVAAVCALSSELQAEVWRDGRAYVQRFARGEPLGPLEDLGPTTRSGTRVSFVPDFTIFTSRAWDAARVARRCRQIAALIPRVTMIFDDEAYRYPDGLRDHVHHLVRDADPVAAPFHVRATRDGIVADCALAWVRRGAGSLDSFVNCSPTTEGTHVEGLFAGLRAVLGRRMPATRPAAFRKQIRRGMVALVNVTLEDPRFRGPTREWLDNPEVSAAVRGVLEDALVTHLARNPAFLDALLIRTGA